MFTSKRDGFISQTIKSNHAILEEFTTKVNNYKN